MKNIVTIHLQDVKIPVIIGTKKAERESKQDIILNLHLQYDAKEAIKNDDIKVALDYENLMKIILNFTANSHFQLLETLASKILELIMKNSLMTKATVRIDKPHALTQAKSTAIEITAKR